MINWFYLLFKQTANTVDKQHFTLLYSRARSMAFTSWDIKSGWSKTGLYPFNLNRVLNDIQKLQLKEVIHQTVNVVTDLSSHSEILPTPVTFESLALLRAKIEQDTPLDHFHQHCFHKLANAAEKAFANCAILLDENNLLFEQNNKKTTWLSVRSTVTGNAKVMTYNDIVEAQRKLDIKEANATGVKGRSRRVQKAKPDECKRLPAEEVELGKCEIKALGLEKYCSVLQFWVWRLCRLGAMFIRDQFVDCFILQHIDITISSNAVVHKSEKTPTRLTVLISSLAPISHVTIDRHGKIGCAVMVICGLPHDIQGVLSSSSRWSRAWSLFWVVCTQWTLHKHLSCSCVIDCCASSYNRRSERCSVTFV